MTFMGTSVSPAVRKDHAAPARRVVGVGPWTECSFIARSSDGCVNGSEPRFRAGWSGPGALAVEVAAHLRYKRGPPRRPTPRTQLRLQVLLPLLEPVMVHGDVERSFARVTRDSREAGPDALFVAIRGGAFDGHDAVPGTRSSIVIVQRPVAAPPGVTVVQVRDTRRALAWACAAVQGFPARSLRVVGVTGTKGKTTTTLLIDGALAHAGRVAGRIGTIGSAVGGVPIASDLTTPDAP